MSEAKELTRSELVSLAKLMYQNDLYSDVIGYMKKVIKMKTPLNFEEIHILFSSYILLKEPFVTTFNSCEGSILDKKLCEELQSKLKAAIDMISNEAIQLLDSDLVKRDTSKESIAHYKCSKAVQHHQRASVASGKDREKKVGEAMKLFKEAAKIADENLNHPAHPVGLCIADEFSKFHYNTLLDSDEALRITKEAYGKIQGVLYEERGKCLDGLSEDLHVYSKQYAKYLGENIENWSR